MVGREFTSMFSKIEKPTKSIGYNYNILCRWQNRPQPPRVIGDTFLRTLDALGKVDPILRHWRLADYEAMRSVPLAQARARISQLVQFGVATDDFGDPEPEDGYQVNATNTPQELETDHAEMFGFGVKAGSRGDNRAQFEAGFMMTLPKPSIVTFPIYRGALLAMIADWPSDWANAYAFDMTYSKTSPVPGAAPVPYTIFHMPWMSYLPAAKAEGLVVPPPITAEKTPDGGLLMIATTDRLDPTNPDHLERARVLSRIMVDRTGLE